MFRISALLVLALLTFSFSAATLSERYKRKSSCLSYYQSGDLKLVIASDTAPTNTVLPMPPDTPMTTRQLAAMHRYIEHNERKVEELRSRVQQFVNLGVLHLHAFQKPTPLVDLLVSKLAHIEAAPANTTDVHAVFDAYTLEQYLTLLKLEGLMLALIDLRCCHHIRKASELVCQLNEKLSDFKQRTWPSFLQTARRTVTCLLEHLAPNGASLDQESISSDTSVDSDMPVKTDMDPPVETDADPPVETDTDPPVKTDSDDETVQSYLDLTWLNLNTLTTLTTLPTPNAKKLKSEPITRASK